MKLDRLIFPILPIILVISFLWMAVEKSNIKIVQEPCTEQIQKRTVWVEGGKEHIWQIEGEDYLVKEAPGGYMEIIGLYERFK